MRRLKSPVGFGAITGPIREMTGSAGRDMDTTMPSNQDLLHYIGDMLLELEGIAQNAGADGLADLLGTAQREVGRNLQKK